VKLLRPTTPLKKLHLERHRGGEIQAVITAALKRDKRYGSGDTMDFALFVIDEMRRRRGHAEEWPP
jgi:hypothetical protein